MNKATFLHLYTVLALLPAIAFAAAGEQQSLKPTAVRENVVEIRLRSPENLAAEGWQADSSGAFVKTLENGVVVEITHGDLARERALEAIDAEVRSLRTFEKTDARQDARLLQLLSERDELARKTPAEDLGQSQNLCTGNAYFDYSAFQDLAYVFADARTTFVRWLQGATALSTTRVTVNGYYDYGWSSGTGLIVESYAGLSVPTWNCSGRFEGMVSLSGVSCVPTTAVFFAPVRCF